MQGVGSGACWTGADCLIFAAQLLGQMLRMPCALERMHARTLARTGFE